MPHVLMDISHAMPHTLRHAALQFGKRLVDNLPVDLPLQLTVSAVLQQPPYLSALSLSPLQSGWLLDFVTRQHTGVDVGAPQRISIKAAAIYP